MTELEKRQNRMRTIVSRFQEYVKTYDNQAHYQDYSDEIFIDDMVYGIGLALEPQEHAAAQGYQKWRRKLIDYFKNRYKD